MKKTEKAAWYDALPEVKTIDLTKADLSYVFETENEYGGIDVSPNWGFELENLELDGDEKTVSDVYDSIIKWEAESNGITPDEFTKEVDVKIYAYMEDEDGDYHVYVPYNGCPITDAVIDENDTW